MLPAPPVLEVYYSATCAPCRLELPALAEAIANGISIHVVLLDDEVTSRRQLAAASPALAAAAEAVPAGSDPRAALRAAGDPDGILPFARVRGANADTCRSWRGALSLERIRQLLATCATSPPRHP